MNTPTPRASILVVDDNPTNLGVLLECLKREHYRVLVAQDGESAVEQARYAHPDLVLLDVLMPGIDGYETCRRLKATPETADIPIVFMTALSDTSHKVRGFEAGGADYVTKPFQYEEVVARVHTHVALREATESLERRVRERTEELERINTELNAEIGSRREAERALEQALAEVDALKNRLQAENTYLREEMRAGQGEIIGQSAPLREVMRRVDMVAVTDATVLITGETGTGKELVARAVHERSPRHGAAMVKLNCAAISAGLVESELFGHVRGAFTGASGNRSGRFQLADRGTLFLDEVSELPLETQAKLLRVLQEGEFEPVGSSTPVRVDVRVIAASNRDLPAAIAAGRFRADLYYRLAVFPLELPPLRERRDDIPVLARFFLDATARRLGRAVTTIEPGTMQRLVDHDWPGNIRDLRNTIERALILSEGAALRVDWDLPNRTLAPPAVSSGAARAGVGTPVEIPPPPRDGSVGTLEEVERSHFIAVLRKTHGVIEGERGAARILDMKPSTARYRIKKLGIRRADYLV